MVTVDFLPNFSPMMLLHGEQYLKIGAPIPSAGTLTTESRIAEVLDKGKAAAVTTVSITKDEEGNVVYENHSTVFLRGSGGFGGKKTGIGSFLFFFLATLFQILELILFLVV